MLCWWLPAAAQQCWHSNETHQKCGYSGKNSDNSLQNQPQNELENSSLTLDMHGSHTYWRIFLVWCILNSVQHWQGWPCPRLLHHHTVQQRSLYVAIVTLQRCYSSTYGYKCGDHCVCVRVCVFGMYQLLLNGYFSDSRTRRKMAKVKLIDQRDSLIFTDDWKKISV